METKHRTHKFTDRERELINFIAGGFKDEETAERMGIQTQTVRSMVNGILKRFNLVNRPQLMVYAAKNNII